MAADTPLALQQIVRFADELPVAIWVARVPSGECVYVNQAFRRVIGIDPPEGAARGNYAGPYSVHTQDGEPYPESAMPYERALAARGPIEVDDIVIHNHDGGRTNLRVYARPLFDEAGEMTYVVEAVTDISREVASRVAQLEREAQLRQAQRMDSLGGLAGGIAHDFNNLLTVIKLIATSLAGKTVDPEVRRGLVRIDEVTDSGSRLTRSLLGFARQGQNLKQRVSFTGLARDVAELVRRTTGGQISVRTELEDGPLDVEGDRAQLEQVLMNLVLNAKDAVHGPGDLGGEVRGEVVVRTARLDVAAGQEADVPPGRYAVLEVQDTGPGIPASLRHRVFEPYFTTKTAGPVKGTGLGLATVFGIVESHHGRVSIARTGSSGTIMRVLLPLASEDAALAPQPSLPPDPPIRAGRGTLLVVDDEPLVLDVTVGLLEAAGYEVTRAAEGAAAVAAFRAAEGRIDAVVLDMVMPVMGGRETYLALRAIDPGVRVLLITGYALNHQAQTLLDLGVRALLEKPFDFPKLSAAVAGVIA